MKTMFSHVAKDESAPSAIEHGLIAGLISVAIIASVSLIGTNLTAKFNTVAGAPQPAFSSAPSPSLLPAGWAVETPSSQP